MIKEKVNQKELEQNQKLGAFFEYLSYLENTQNISQREIFIEKLLTLVDKLDVIPMVFLVNKEKRIYKIDKRPLVKWKSELNKEEIKSYLENIKQEYKKGEFTKGVAIIADQYEICVIDIDHLDRFNEFFEISSFLEDIKKDAYLIVKSLSGRGYHIYLNKQLLNKSLLSINKNKILEKFGFEIKHKDLLVIYPSIYKDDNYQKKFKTEIVYVNKENFEKEKMESKSLKKLINYLEEEIEKVRKAKIEKDIKKTINRLKKERKKFKDLEQIIKEVKEKVKFKDILSKKFVEHKEHYDRYHCPFHPPDDKPSFVVYQNEDGEIAVDFHDEKIYDIISFYETYKGINFLDALKDLCKLTDIPFPENNQIQKSVSMNYLFESIITEKAFYTSCFNSSRNIKKRYAMFKKEKQIWEVDEKENSFVDDNKYNSDKNSAFDVYIINQNIDHLGRYRYTYLAFYPKKQIADFIIGEIIENIDPLNPQQKSYDVQIITKYGDKITFKDINLENLISQLENTYLIVNKQKIKEALSKILSDLNERNISKKEIKFSKPGIFLYKNDIVVSRIDNKEISREDLKESLLFLNELVVKRFAHIQDKFITSLKWFLIAPFSFVAKQGKSSVKALYLYGVSGTGKSTLCLLLGNIWRSVNKVIEKTGGSIDTISRLGSALSENTFPVIISEPMGALMKEEIRESLKNALTSIIVRSKHTKIGYQDIYALSNIVFTSNHFLPNDDALLRRFFIISFSKKDIPETFEKLL